jgi:hypothetical protein
VEAEARAEAESRSYICAAGVDRRAVVAGVERQRVGCRRREAARWLPASRGSAGKLGPDSTATGAVV